VKISSNLMRAGGRKQLQTSGTPGLGRATLDASKALASSQQGGPHPKDYKTGNLALDSPEAKALQGLGSRTPRPFTLSPYD